MKIKLVTVGKIRPGPHKELADQYITRLSHYIPFEHAFVADEEQLIKKISKDDFLVVCDERGRLMESKEFSRFIEEKQIRSTKGMTIAIGPAEGFSEEIRKEADLLLAVSKFTLQHDLVALVILEQIYRALTIIKGEPYHK